MALATPAVFYCAAPVLRLAWAGARHGVIRMESLLAMGILTAYGYSAVAGLPRRHARLLRHRLRHRDPGARRQGDRARRQGDAPPAPSRCSTA